MTTRVLRLAVAVTFATLSAQAADKGTFGYDAEWVAKYTKTLTLKRGDARCCSLRRIRAA
jgi:hypothetical protein